MLTQARLAERIARQSYGRLLALIARRTHDIAAAEDALSEAFAAALVAWARLGPPEHPEAWLMAAAKRKLIDAARRNKTARAAEGELVRIAEELEAAMQAAPPAMDRRLELMFACAHPAVERGARTPLMLQVVLGLSAERIARAYLVAPAAMGQRLVRAKARLRETGAAFEIPAPEERPARLADVLEAIYAAYGADWEEGLEDGPDALGVEALWLARVAAGILPNEGEAQALLALILFIEARAPARRDSAGAYAPLDAQDVRLWRRDCLDEAIALMAGLAGATARMGRFQIEASIQHVHCGRAFGLAVAWPLIARLYGALHAATGSPIALLNRIAAEAHYEGAAFALAALNALVEEAPSLAAYQPYWALRADLCARLGDVSSARAAYEDAMRLARGVAVRAFLAARCAAL